MEETAQDMIEESDMIQVHEPVQNKDPFDMDLGNVDNGMDMGLQLPDMGLGLDF